MRAGRRLVAVTRTPLDRLASWGAPGNEKISYPLIRERVDHLRVIHPPPGRKSGEQGNAEMNIFQKKHQRPQPLDSVGCLRAAHAPLGAGVIQRLHEV